MRGFPVPRDRRVPRQDWDRAPWNRWSFQHMREILPTVEVRSGSGPAWSLPSDRRDLDGVGFESLDGPTTVGRWLDTSYTDGFIVLHRGRIVFERYMNGMTEHTLHLSQSVAKSVTGSVAGILVGRGLLDLGAPVTDYLPELQRTAWKGAKLRHVLDMTSGVRFVEDYEALDSDIAVTDVACGWKLPRGRAKLPGSVWEQILSLKAVERGHGERFQYRSIETDVLAHCLERVTGTRLAELVGRELWTPMGAEEHACFTVDAAGYALADGGFNACLRDYARFGQMHLDDGIANGRRIVPHEWIADTRRGNPSVFGEPYTDVLPRGAYRNQFWIEEVGRPTYMARGVFGQIVYIAPDAGMVAVKLSSWPEFTSVPRSRDVLRAFHAIAEALDRE